jgi:hypothetical protein
MLLPEECFRQEAKDGTKYDYVRPLDGLPNGCLKQPELKAKLSTDCAAAYVRMSIIARSNLEMMAVRFRR